MKKKVLAKCDQLGYWKVWKKDLYSFSFLSACHLSPLWSLPPLSLNNVLGRPGVWSVRNGWITSFYLFCWTVTIAGSTLALATHAHPSPAGWPNSCSHSVCFICSPIGNYLAEIIVFLFCIFSSYEPCRRMTISDPVFAFQSVRSLVLAECVEVTFTVQKEDLPYVCFGQIYVQTLLFVCELICCQARVYLDKQTHTCTHVSLV